MRLSERHSAETRAVIMRAARGTFTTRGYQATSVDEIVEKARVSKGALYHHFKSKEELFEAVFMDIDMELNLRLQAEIASALSPDPWSQMIASAIAHVDAAAEDSSFRQIVLLDGPAVLGWPRWREIQASTWIGSVETKFAELMATGAIQAMPVRELVQVIVAALNESVMIVANADDPDAARQAMRTVVTALLEGLRASQKRRPR
jgi:AcrR family transcriptional regulator